MTHNNNKIVVIPKLISVCGNIVVVCKIININIDSFYKLNFLSQLCWKNGHRIADGIVCFYFENNCIRYCFFNPDGTFEKICGNGLLGVGKMIGCFDEIKILPYEYPEISICQISNGYRIKTPVRINVNSVKIEGYGTASIHDSGSPHLLMYVDDVFSFDLLKMGPMVTQKFNVNLTIFSFDNKKNIINARTFERGVEDETKACGTGALTVAIEAKIRKINSTMIKFSGGEYKIEHVVGKNIPSVSIWVSNRHIKFEKRTISLGIKTSKQLNTLVDYKLDKEAISKLSMEDIDQVMELQKAVVDSLSDREVFYIDTKSYIEDLISKKGIIYGVFSNNKLIACVGIKLIIDKSENLGEDIGLPESEFSSVAHFDSIIVHPFYRRKNLGNSLARKAIYIVAKSRKRHILGTVSPKNIASLNMFLKIGMKIMKVVQKYGGLDRYIMYREI